ncbi:MAG: diaminopimelate decarboxylase [Planctomycetota bacterium]|jgi:diaminopimelate decarboxylase
MDLFEYRNGKLCCEGLRVAEIVAEVGTPAYVYSAGTLRHHYRRLAEAFAPLSPLICFAVKSLCNVNVLKLLAAEGSGFDVVSGGEVARALAAGADPERIVYAGVGKTDDEIRQAIATGIGMFNVESEQEFENVSCLAGQTGRSVRAALRINPDVDPKTHRYTTTGKKETKFGVDLERAERFFDTYGGDEHVKLDAIHLHIGSPVYSAQPYVDAINKTLNLMARLSAKGCAVRTLNIGGGFGADYAESQSPTAAEYAEHIVPLLADTGLEIILEPGRQIACNAGVLLTEVQYVKQGGERNFVIVDAAMTDLIRPALYESEHFVYPVDLADGDVPQRRPDFAAPGGVKVDIVGGVCESSDFLAKDRVLPAMTRGDLVAVFSAGAYGFGMASQYNSRPRACEALVEGDQWRLVRQRETYDDLMAAEKACE